MDIYLIRHTAVDVISGTCYGQSDVPLHANCKEHFSILEQKLPALENPLVLSSPASRCLHLARHLSTRVETDERLRELHFGAWENQLWNTLPQEELNSWMENYVEGGPPGGESYRQLFERAVACWKERVVKADENHLLVVAHAGLIRSLLGFLLDIPLKNTFKLQIDYGSISQVNITNGYTQLAYINR